MPKVISANRGHFSGFPSLNANSRDRTAMGMTDRDLVAQKIKQDDFNPIEVTLVSTVIYFIRT